MQLIPDLTGDDLDLAKAFLAATLISIIGTAPQGTITIFNHGAELMLGYSAEEMVGKQTPLIFHLPEEIEARGAALSSLLKRPVHGFDVFASSIDVENYEQLAWTYVHKDGHHLTVLLSLSERRTDDGQLLGYMGAAKDITKLDRAAKGLAAERARLYSMMECTTEGAIQIDRQWRILYGNRGAREAFQQFEAGKDFWNCFPALLGTRVEQYLRRTMQERVPINYEHSSERYNQWFRVKAFPIDEGIGLLFGDITEEKKLQGQLEVERMLREKRIESLSHMAAGLAHEISNPLAIIHARASDLKDMARTDAPYSIEDVRTACDSILFTSERAMKVLRSLRGFAREVVKDPMQPASIYDLAEQCLEQQQARFDSNNIEVRMTIAEGIPLVSCREQQISQVLSNVLSNAFDAVTQPNSTERWVSLAATCSEDKVSIDITDSGPPIEERLRPHLMEPFFTTKELGAGMGVALSLSRSIALEHGGGLTLLSDTPHTCFRLVLPIRFHAGTTQQNGLS